MDKNVTRIVLGLSKSVLSSDSSGVNDADTLEISRAEPSEAQRYALVSAQTFYEAYAATAVPENMAVHIAREFGEPQQRRELEDPAVTVLAAREPSGDWAGFTALHADRTADGVIGSQPVEIVRFYVRGRWHGRGAAKRLMHEALRHAAARGHDAIWLQVWEENARARRFYEKCGFRAVGTKPFLFGDVQERDTVYAQSLDPSRLAADAPPPIRHGLRELP